MINSYEFGTSVSLDYPRLVIPFMKYKWSRYPSSTQFKLYADQLNRAGYFRLLSLVEMLRTLISLPLLPDIRSLHLG